MSRFEDVGRHLAQFEIAERPPKGNAQDDSVHLALDRFINDGMTGITCLKKLAIDWEVLAARGHLRLTENVFTALGLGNQFRIQCEGTLDLEYVDDMHAAVRSLRHGAGELNCQQAGLGTIDGHKQRFDRGDWIFCLYRSVLTAKHANLPFCRLRNRYASPRHNQRIIIKIYATGKCPLRCDALWPGPS